MSRRAVFPPLNSSDILAFQFSSWYPTFASVSIKSTIIRPTPSEFEEYLHEDGVFVPEGADDVAIESSLSDKGDGDEDEDEDAPRRTYAFPELDEKIRECIKTYGAVFPKLNFSSPQDASWVLPASSPLKCTSPADVYMLLKSSDFITHDITRASVFEGCNAPAEYQLELVLRKWYPVDKSREVRCFVRDDKLLGISQRDSNFYEFWNDPATQQKVVATVKDFWESKIRQKWTGPRDYIFDLLLTRDLTRAHIIDFNPFAPRTDALLFTYDNLAGLDGDTPELRVIDSAAHPAASSTAPANQHNMVPFEALALSSGVDIDAFAERHDAMDLETELTNQLAERAKRYITEKGMDPTTAMQTAQAELLKNNPYNPPTGDKCPVNNLPVELLTHIFQLGCQIEAEEEENGPDDGYGDDDDDEDEDDEEDALNLNDGWETDSEDGDGEADEVIEVDEDDEDVRMSSPKKKKRGKLPAPESPGGRPAPDSDSEDDEDDDFRDGEEIEDEEPFFPFQVLVSHVCKKWRSVALDDPTLWTRLRFDGHMKLPAATEWLKRSNGLPLEIYIDATHSHDHPVPDPVTSEPPSFVQSLAASMGINININMLMAQVGGPAPVVAPVQTFNPHDLPPMARPEPCLSAQDVREIMALLAPHVAQWRLFEVTVENYDRMFVVLESLAECPGAPLLEDFGLYHYEQESEETEHFQPAALSKAFLPFHGNAPNIKNAALWGVHVDWTASLSFLQNLNELELAYHVRDVRPTFETFREMITRSPQLTHLSLCFSGPTGDLEVIEIPTLQKLVLCYLERDYIKPLVGSFVLPALEELTLDLADEDFTEFAEQLAGRGKGLSRSLLAGLTRFKIDGLPCSDAAAALVFGQLENVHKLLLNCDFLDEEERERFYKLLLKASPVSATTPMYLPKLDFLRIAGLDGDELQTLVKARKAMKVPLAQLWVSTRDEVDSKDDEWLKKNVETFDYYEPSDESDLEMDDEIEGEEMDQD
ncbi:hypothetical protein MKEN_00895100 [Mycena kentingensis (nom. inval.)]|nr:hypothetical protein MKEN_00895100 [Mycena kentingensis (nom. inval.)]